MSIKNRYQKCGKISERKLREIIKYFSLDLTASNASRLAGVNVRSVNTIYLKIRQRLHDVCAQEARMAGLIEMDECYFGARRIRGK